MSKVDKSKMVIGSAKSSPLITPMIQIEFVVEVTDVSAARYTSYLHNKIIGLSALETQTSDC